jgi:hypothetical protein
MPTAVFDLDGVICNFFGEFLTKFGEHAGIHREYRDVHRYDYYVELGVSLEEMLDFAIKHNVLIDAPLLPGAASAINRLSASGVQIAVVTARDYHPDAMPLTVSYLKRMGVHVDKLIISGNDKMSSFSELPDNCLFYVDDLASNLETARNSGKFKNLYLMSQPWNIDCDLHPGVRIDSLAGLKELIDFKVESNHANSNFTETEYSL